VDTANGGPIASNAKAPQTAKCRMRGVFLSENILLFRHNYDTASEGCPVRLDITDVTITQITPSSRPRTISITPPPVVSKLNSWFEDAAGAVAGNSAIYVFRANCGETVGV